MELGCVLPAASVARVMIVYRPVHSSRLMRKRTQEYWNCGSTVAASRQVAVIHAPFNLLDRAVQ